MSLDTITTTQSIGNSVIISGDVFIGDAPGASGGINGVTFDRNGMTFWPNIAPPNVALPTALPVTIYPVPALPAPPQPWDSEAIRIAMEAFRAARPPRIRKPRKPRTKIQILPLEAKRRIRLEDEEEESQKAN